MTFGLRPGHSFCTTELRVEKELMYPGVAVDNTDPYCAPEFIILARTDKRQQHANRTS